MIRAAAIEAAAQRFWHAAGGRPASDGPIDIAAAVPRALPAGVLEVPGLTTAHVAALLDRIGAAPWRNASPRQLRGCVVAQAGLAMILVRADDNDDERRFTVAHEAAHLELHYLAPRRRALDAFGPRITAVLDGTRPASRAEAFSAALRDIDVAPFQHAMERSGKGLSGGVSAMEDEADELALELLAPRHVVEELSSPSPGEIRARFGIPAKLAAALTTEINRPAPTMGVLGLFAAR